MNILSRKGGMHLNRMRKVIIFFSFFLSFVCQASAEDTIFLGGVSIKIGDDKDNLIQELGKFNKISIAPETPKELFSITVLKEGEPIGVVQCKQDKVIYVGKSWSTNFENQGKEVIKSLIGAISGIPESRRMAFVSLNRRFSPDITLEEIRLAFGKREIVILLIERKNVTTIQVDEYLR